MGCRGLWETKNEVEILYRRNKVRSANQRSGRAVESSRQRRMGSSSGFPIAYARCSWARLCAIQTADKIKVAHGPLPEPSKLQLTSALRTRPWLQDGDVTFSQTASLHTSRRRQLRRLLCWRECDQRNAHDTKQSHCDQQFSAFARNLECLYGHNSGMSKARPCCEGD